MQDYRKLKVWEKAHLFTLEMYTVTKLFPKEEIFGLALQFRRASSSMPANIAEGCGRSSNKELAHFLNISLGSVNEVEYFTLLAKDLNYIDQLIFEKLHSQINEIKGMLIGLVNKIRSISEKVYVIILLSFLHLQTYNLKLKTYNLNDKCRNHRWRRLHRWRIITDIN